MEEKDDVQMKESDDNQFENLKDKEHSISLKPEIQSTDQVNPDLLDTEGLTEVKLDEVFEEYNKITPEDKKNKLDDIY